MLNKLFKFYNTRADFESQNRLVEQLDNDAYVNQDGIATWGDPDIYLENICFIADEGVIFTHNKEFGNSSKTVAIAELLKFYDPINRIFKESYTDEETGETVSLSDVNGTLLGTDILLEILNDEYIIAATLNSYDVRLKNVEAGGNLLQGTNISIANNTISAVGYKYDSTKTSFSTGYATQANGVHSFAAGRDSIANERCASAIGENAKALGARSHAEGYGTHATDNCAHAEGFETTAEKSYAHSEGFRTKASGDASHTEGKNTKASGSGSHAEGSDTVSSGEASHAEGYHTIAQNTGEHATGKYNKSNAETINSIGIGTSDTDRKNALEVTQSGDIYVLGIGNYEGNNIDSAQTLQYCLNNINVEPGDIECNMMVNVTYDELVNLCLENMLQPGAQYRITDYETATVQNGTMSAGHKFDIIVSALTENTLSENASACYHDDIITRELSNHTEISEFYDVHGIGLGSEGDMFHLVLNEYGEGNDNMGWVYEYNGKGYFRYTGSSNRLGQLLFDFSLGEISNENHIRFYPNFYSTDGGVTWINSTEVINNDSELPIAEGFELPIITTEYESNYTNPEILQSIIDEFNYRNYFKIVGANLSVWKLKYCLDNDTDKFAWADTNGKGVIYEMTDEFNNTLPYDFKNIMFKRYVVSQGNNSIMGEYAAWEGISIESLEYIPSDYKYFYTFSCYDNNVYDSSLNIYSNNVNKLIVTNNHYLSTKIQLTAAKGKQYILNDIAHICKIALEEGNYCSGVNNTKLGLGCYNCTILDGCINWEIKDNSKNIIICSSCNDWKIGNNANNIIIEVNNSGWKIGNGCNNISIAPGCSSWMIENSSFNISTLEQCSNWKIGIGCHDFILHSSINGFEMLNGFNGLIDGQSTIINLPYTDFRGQKINYPLFIGQNEYNILTIWNPASPINYQYVERNTYWGGDFTTGTPHDILPNTYNEWTSKAPKSIRLVNSEENKTAEYILKFTVSESGHSIVFENEIKWRNNDIPMWETGKTYEINIMNGLASYMEF